MDAGTLEVPEGLRRITIIEPERKLVLSDRRMILSRGQEYALSSLLTFHPRYGLGLVSRYGRWLDSSTQGVLGNKDLNIIGVEGAVYDVAGRFDVYLGLQGVSNVRSEFNLDSTAVQQKYTYLEANTHIGKRFKVSMLSDFGESRGHETFVLAKAGLTGAFLKRSIAAEDFSQPRQITQRLGWSGALHLETLLLDSKMLLGAGMSTVILPDFAVRDRSSVRLEIGVSLGQVF